MNITGKQFLVAFGKAKAILHFQSMSMLTFIIKEIDGNAVDITETVDVKLTEIRPQLFMATWKEKNGNTITQVQDYEKGIVYSNWTTPTGKFINETGSLKLVE